MSQNYFELAQKQIELGKPESKIKASLDKAYKANHKTEWTKAKQAEHLVLFPLTETVLVDELQEDGTTIQVEQINTLVQSVSFNEWINDTNSVLIGTETLYDDLGVAYESEVFEEQAIHIYIEALQSDIDILVGANTGFVNYTRLVVENVVHESLSKLTVVTVSGNTFDATLEARQNMADGVLASETLALTQTTWRLADNTEVVVDVTELREAHALALLAYAQTKAIGA